MEDVFRFADDLGPLKLVHIHRSSIGLKAVVAIDNVACGPAIGGVRMAPDVSTEEAFRLARAMTFKNASAGLPHGGGKSVIFADPKMPLSDKEQLIRGFAAAIADLKEYIPGPIWGPTNSQWAGSRTRLAAPWGYRAKSAAFRSTRLAPPGLVLSPRSTWRGSISGCH